MNKLLLVLSSVVVSLCVIACNNDQSSVRHQTIHPLIDEGMTLMNRKAILDSTAEYNDAPKRGYNASDICIIAGKIKAAYERAEEEDEALAWGKLEKIDCKNAGL